MNRKDITATKRDNPPANENGLKWIENINSF